MRVRFIKAFVMACAALMAAIAFTTPVAQAWGWERPGLGSAVSRVIGLTITSAIVLLVLHTSVLLVLERATRSRLNMSRWTWAALGLGLSMVPYFAFSMPEAVTWWEQFSESADALLSTPALFVSESIPAMIGGAVFGGLLFERRGCEQPSAG
jgi:hypothetical protein